MKPLALSSLFVVVAFFSTALAQTELEVFVGAYDPNTDLAQVDFEGGMATGFRLGQSFLGFLGTEFGYTLATGLENRLGSFDESVHLLNANFLVQLPLAGFVPFGTFGLGGIVGQNDTNFKVRSVWTWNAGGGLKIRNLIGPLGARFDLRYYNIPDGIELLDLPPEINRENFNLVEVSAGLLLTF